MGFTKQLFLGMFITWILGIGVGMMIAGFICKWQGL